MSTPLETLVAALSLREREFRDAIASIDRVAMRTRDADAEVELDRSASRLRDAVRLVECLRRLIADRSVNEIHGAFGAPGNWGYDTPLGDALARVYGVRT